MFSFSILQLIPIVAKARGEMLKFAIERELGQACSNYAERKQVERSKTSSAGRER